MEKVKAKPSLAYITQVLRDMGIREREVQALLDKKITATTEQLKLLSDNQISSTNPVFAGFEIHNLYEFFMVFVVLTGVAAVILFLLTPLLRKMMHGVK